MRALVLTFTFLSFLAAAASPAFADTPHRILFVTQVPTAAFQNVASAFGAHQPSMQQTPRGGDLWIRYPGGALRNLTREAGFGLDGAQDGAGAIAVRQPTAHWSGTKAIFAMLVGAPSRQYEVITTRWQLYEVTGLATGETARITKIPCQPPEYNNIAPVYGSDEQILFVSDRPRNGAVHLYPQRDEYESSPIDTGIWKLDPVACSFRILEHAPSGVTYPSVDAAGRVVFTKWDHLLRDQQADSDTFANGPYGTFNYDSEESTAVPPTHSRAERFPELRRAIYSKLPGQGYDGSTPAADYPFSDLNFNHFFPWMMNQDGSEEETLNHVGRHEIGGSYTDGSYRNDPNLRYDYDAGELSGATYFLYGSGGMFHLREDPTVAGRFYGVVAPEFATATAGDLVRIDAAPAANAEGILVEPLAKAAEVGRTRNPLPLSDGTVVAVHTAETGELVRSGSSTSPSFNYGFRLRRMNVQGAKLVPGAELTAGIAKSIQYWDPDSRVTWSGNLWELDPVEVRSRPIPPRTRAPMLPSPEKSALATAGVPEALLRNWLHQRQLALVVSRNVTSRDRQDEQQPFNLKVAGGTQTLGAGGAVYTVSHAQFFQADQVRGYANGGIPQSGGTPSPGRRVLATPLHDPAAIQAMGAHLSGPQASTPVWPDGSIAAFLPAGRAMAWQLLDSSKSGWARAIVRERNWVSFRRGETRVCANCHGANVADQAGNPPPENVPAALTALLGEWRKVVRNSCAETGGTGTWSYDGVQWSAVEDGERYRIQTCQGGNGCCDGLPATETEGAAVLEPGNPERVATGAGEGGEPRVRVWDPVTGAVLLDFLAFPSAFTGGVRVALGDVNGDGTADVVAGAGPGGAPEVRVFDGVTGDPFPAPFGSFLAYDASFAGGVFVAAGDVNGDGIADVIAGPGAGARPRVKIWDGMTGTLYRKTRAFERAFRGGVRVAAGDVDADGRADLVAGAGAGRSPELRLFSGATGLELRTKRAFPADFTFGIHVAAADVDGDGRADVVAGAGEGAKGRVKVFNGATGTRLSRFVAYPDSAGGVRLGLADLDGDGRSEVLAGEGPGGGTVRAFDGATGAPLPSGALGEFDPYGVPYDAGVWVGG